MGSSAVGSCIRCCRFRCVPGEGTLGIPAHCPRKHRWAGGPQLCCPRCATFTVAWQAAWGCIRASRPRLPWSVRCPGLRPRPAHHRGHHPQHPASSPEWRGLCGFCVLPSHSSLFWGLSISSPSLLNVFRPFWGLCLPSVLSHTCLLEAHSALLCTRSHLLQPCSPENELTVLSVVTLY